MDDQKTEVFPALDMGEPVDSVYDLPKPGKEGESRYVREESAVYGCRQGVWVKEIYKKTP